MIEEGNALLEHIEDESTRDAALVVIAQRMQHYAIATHGSIRAHAQQLGLDGVVERVDRILKDEKKLDKRLSALAEKRLNEKALAHA